jgi:hypothetical protein
MHTTPIPERAKRISGTDRRPPGGPCALADDGYRDALCPSVS